MDSLIEGRKAIPLLLKEEYLLMLKIEADKRNVWRKEEKKITPSHIATEIVEEYFAHGRSTWLYQIEKKIKADIKKGEESNENRKL